MRSGVRDVAEIAELALNLGRHCDRLVTQSPVECQIRTPAPVILKVHGKERLAKTARAEGVSKSGIEPGRYVGQKVSQRPKVPDTARIGERHEVELHPFDSAPKFQRMLPGSKKGIIIDLVVIQVIEVGCGPAQPTSEVGKPRYPDLGRGSTRNR